MDVINILDAQSANMIAAGEVVDRPASAIKELVENAIDAGSTEITVEIENGGNTRIRVSDNGKGISATDLPKAVLRHATSKIKTGADIDGVMTLGFRGEALAAIAAVSRLEIISKQKDSEYGSILTSDENGVTVQEIGCPDGTTVLVNDIFYNTPARRKFLKKDVTEAAAAQTVTEKAALSNPQIAFKFINNGEIKFSTSGDGKLFSAIYSVMGKQMAKGFTELRYELDFVKVRGYVSLPEFARGNRSAQNVFVNGRYVVSKTVQAALSEAFKSFLPGGKFPAAVLFLDVPPLFVDVNVHPAKIEIKFADERKVYEGVYYAVKDALLRKDAFVPAEEREKRLQGDGGTQTARRPQEELFVSPSAEKTASGVGEGGAKPSGASGVNGRMAKAYGAFGGSLPMMPRSAAVETRAQSDAARAEAEAAKKRKAFAPSAATLEAGEEAFEKAFGEKKASEAETEGQNRVSNPTLFEAEEKTAAYEQSEMSTAPIYRLAGEVFDAYLLVETEKAFYVIDKHAAHERLLYEKLARNKKAESQQLLAGIVVSLSTEEAAVLSQNLESLSEFGFEAEVFGDDAIIVRAVPAAIKEIKELDVLMQGFARELLDGVSLSFNERCDKALYTLACKAALKAGVKNGEVHNKWLVDSLFEEGNIKYCPHGRPIMKEFSRKEMDKWFDR